MSHLADEQLVDYRYAGGSDRDERVAAHLAECASCRANFEALESTLAAVDAVPVPDRGDDYGAQRP